MKIGIIGGGAAGFFAAINAKENHPDALVVLYDKSSKLLSKVRISGGGRCNVTNGCTSIPELAAAYPRGGKKLKKAFRQFSTTDTVQWFEKRGVKLYVQDDGRMFPTSDSSQSVIDCFMREVTKLGIQINTGHAITAIECTENYIKLSIGKDESQTKVYDKVIVATGGSPKRRGLEWLEAIGHKIIDPLPSLFTFNMPNESITKLMGVVAENAIVSIQSSKFNSEGPLLVTHWGMSGPAILKLSAFGARYLHEQDYKFQIQVNWCGIKNDSLVREALQEIANENARKNLSNAKPFQLPDRLWLFLLDKCGLPADKKWDELGKKGINKLINILTHDIYNVHGKTTFKEEFVTCGGVSLESIDFNSMQSRACKNLYFAGEVLNIDGITGGYNFQAAWTTAYIAAKLET